MKGTGTREDDSMERRNIETARDMMARKVVTLRPEMAAIEAAEVLIKNGISGAPVVGKEGELLGLLSEFDCLRAVAAADYEMDRHDARERVGDLMTREPRTVGPDVDLLTLAHAFVTQRVRRFPVVDEAGKLLGQVSRRDALKAAVRLRHERLEAHPHYPDYPRGREPIRNYPRG